MPRKKVKKYLKQIEKLENKISQCITEDNDNYSQEMLTCLFELKLDDDVNEELTLQRVKEIEQEYDDYLKSIPNRGIANHYKQLVVGETYKNYNVLCSILCEKKTSGNSKVCQLENWANYFSWDKSGHKFTITEIKENPVPRVDKRTYGNNRKYY